MLSISRTKVNIAGSRLVKLSNEAESNKNSIPKILTDYLEDWEIAENWRSRHSDPLEYITSVLRDESKKVSPNIVVAHRLKRMSSIIEKLELEGTMKLSQMQDIAGCRVIAENIDQVDEIVAGIKNLSWSHEWRKTDDYIREPKKSGYRGVHLIYKYRCNDKIELNDLMIEIQVRTGLQHIWASAVEIIGEIKKQALKKSLGDERWKRFFALMGSFFAIEENNIIIPGTPSSLREISNELRGLEKNLGMMEFMLAIKLFTEEISEEDNAPYYWLITTNYDGKTVNLKAFNKTELTRALMAYHEQENNMFKNPAMNSVLVSVDSMKDLKEAYSSYFPNLDEFISGVFRAFPYSAP